MVHHLLEALAEGAPSNACKAFLRLGEGDGPNARCHPKLLHHGVGNASDLPQIILCPWSVGSRKGFLLVMLSQGTLLTHWHTTGPDGRYRVPRGQCILLIFLKRVWKLLGNALLFKK